MNSRFGIVLASMLGAVCARTATLGADAEEGFVSLFDGKTLEGWEITGAKKDGWVAQDGTIAWNGRGGRYLRYGKPFGDFVLRLEFKVSKGANSGIMLRTQRTGSPPYTGFEVQVYDDHGKEPDVNSSGSIYDVLTPMRNMAKPAGEWNSMEITCQGTLVKVVYNGFKVIDTDFVQLTAPIGKFKTPYARLPLTGYISFQDHGHPVWFRNIRIKEMK